MNTRLEALKTLLLESDPASETDRLKVRSRFGGYMEMWLALFIWDDIIAKHDEPEVVDRWSRMRERWDDPSSQMGPEIRKMLDEGISNESILTLIRCTQYLTLVYFAHLIDPSGLHMDTGKEISVGLFEVDEDENPVGRPLDVQELWTLMPQDW
ncbi:MAG: hypothetical protein AAF525_06510 [Pseudomonadota bacterium]